MKKELSILIPNYNYDCRRQVQDLCKQSAAIEGLQYEVIVADDGSTDREKTLLCREMAQWPLCRFIELNQNIGRARIRNFLARQASFQWLLFMDSDMGLPTDFVKNYLATAEGDVFDGGVSIAQGPANNLRYLYEKANESRHTAEQRRRQPHQHFHTANFMIRREVMLAHPFDERFTHYGYEDVLFGKQLHKNNVRIEHIDNPAIFGQFDENAPFVAKTEEGLRTLYQFRQELRGYSALLTFVEGIHIKAVLVLLRLWHKVFGSLERKLLCSRHPWLRLFNIYKLGYFISLTNDNNK